MSKFVIVETVLLGLKKTTYINLDHVKVIEFIKTEQDEFIEFDMNEGVPIKAPLPHDSDFALDLLGWLNENRLNCSVG